MKYKNHFQCLIKSAQFIYVLLSKKINPLFSQFKYLASHECSLLRRKPCILSIYISLILSLVFLKQDNLLSLELSFAKIISFNRNELLL